MIGERDRDGDVYEKLRIFITKKIQLTFLTDRKRDVSKDVSLATNSDADVDEVNETTVSSAAERAGYHLKEIVTEHISTNLHKHGEDLQLLSKNSTIEEEERQQKQRRAKVNKLMRDRGFLLCDHLETMLKQKANDSLLSYNVASRKRERNSLVLSLCKLLHNLSDVKQLLLDAENAKKVCTIYSVCSNQLQRPSDWQLTC